MVFLTEADVDAILFAALTPRLEVIFRRHYGIGDPVESVAQIAQVFAVSKERISLVLTQAQKRLERVNSGYPPYEPPSKRKRYKTELRKATYAIARHLRSFGCKADSIVDAWQSAFT